MKKLLSLLLALLLALSVSPAGAVQASLNQRMATRSGPSTLYTEELGTLPQNTPITLIEQVMGSVPWGLVEFEKRGLLYRAYTGMKRINAYGEVPWGIQEGTHTQMQAGAQVYYGPGQHYAPRQEYLSAGQAVLAFGWENGYVMVEYTVGSKKVRGYVPDTSVQGFTSQTTSAQPLQAFINLSDFNPRPGQNLAVTFLVTGGTAPYEYHYIWEDDIDFTGSGTGDYAQVSYPVREGMYPRNSISFYVTDARGAEASQRAQFMPQNAQAEEVAFEVPANRVRAGNNARVVVWAQYSPNVYMGYLWYDYRWVFEDTAGRRSYGSMTESPRQQRSVMDYTPSSPGKLWLECRVYDSGDGYTDYSSPVIEVY